MILVTDAGGHPTRHEISTDYMLPTKLLEYLAFGIPAVFTPTKTVRHYFGDEHPLHSGPHAAVAIATARRRNAEIGLARRIGRREEFFNSVLVATSFVSAERSHRALQAPSPGR